jgi:ribonuclease HII
MKTIGVDEVGRGCLAGPVAAAAVLLDEKSIEALSGLHLTDSKAMTKLQREKAYVIITNSTIVYGVGWVFPKDIDKYGLTEAVRSAMQQAVNAITEDYDEIIIDGNYNFLKDNPKTRTLIKADLTEISVSAASVVAKVERDRYMKEQSMIHVGYGFDAHVGYGTLAHMKALKALGPCILHRRSVKPVAALS